ncbi:hypothetical protein H5410_060153 [Solanum commersonii]|uniref:Uncharacterized protein n=1 Tax=Solanum commersonii TaxID=4109 RepID=A0A9J5W4B0_SOLCO|nr:hypothetical protein H5410_060153 [Solanum commersonii]
MEPVGPNGQNGSFSKSNEPRSCSSSLLTLAMELFGPDSQNGLFSMSKALKACKPPYFTDFHLALTVKMVHFQSQTIPEADKPLILPIFVCYNLLSFLVIRNSYLWSHLALTAKMAHFQGQTSLGKGKSHMLVIFMCYSSLSFLMIQNFNVIFAKKFHVPPLRPYLWSQLALTVKMIHFKGQTIPGVGKPPILSIFVYSSPWIFGDPKFQRHFCQKFSLTSVKTLVMQPVGPNGQNGPLLRSYDSQSWKTLHFSDFRVL